MSRKRRGRMHGDQEYEKNQNAGFEFRTALPKRLDSLEVINSIQTAKERVCLDFGRSDGPREAFQD